MKMKAVRNCTFFALCCFSISLASCGWLGGITKSSQNQDGKASPDAVSAGHVITAKVDERDLILPDEVGARSYLQKKLLALMVKDLLALGFDGKKASCFAKSAVKKDLFVRGHMEKVIGQGTDAGKIHDENLWDVRGKLQVSLSDSRLDDLLKNINARPLSSMDHVAYLESVFHHMDEKKIVDEKFVSLRKKVANKWAELLMPWLKRQMEIPVQPLNSYLNTLKRVSLVLADFYKAHPQHHGFAKLEKAFTLAAIKAVRSFEVKSENFEAVKTVLARIEKMAGAFIPGLMGYIKRDLELAWRDYLVTMDDKKEAFPKMRVGFIYFLELFPKSQFYPDLELRFLSRWYDYLMTFAPKTLHGLDEMLRQVNLFHKRFPRFDGLKDVDLALGKHCTLVLSRVDAPNLDTMLRIDEALCKCEPYFEAGHETVQMRERLEQLEQKLVDARDDKREKKALENLDFFVQWDKAIENLPWGIHRNNWSSDSAFMSKWNEGKNAGNECRCTLDPREPCRIFDVRGSAGGFEVVVRFLDDRLSGVDLCEVYTGSKMEAIYRFFARRYEALHSGRQAATFLAGRRNGNRLSFVKDDRIQVTLERATDTCTVRFRSVKMMTEEEKKDKEQAAEQMLARAKARKARIEKGWKPGQCVRWECKPVCQYRGRTKTKKQNRYMVTITHSRKSPIDEGSGVWVSEDSLFDCQ